MKAPVRNLQFAICSLQFAIVFSLQPLRDVPLLAAEPPPVRSPVSPHESLQHLVVTAELAVELVAHEPNVIDPVAIRFDEDGRMWVVEMRDYPTATTKGIKARSRISILTDQDGDGFFEAATVFADGLPYATGVQPWQGGVFVTMAGKVAYMKDTNSDNKADVVETWYTGFAQKNTQLRANHPQLALDNHIYIANGLLGGAISDARRAGAKPVSISGRDFRFDPLTREFEAVSGVGQFGLTFDDYGNRFVCSNRNPSIHVVLEDRHLKKNPLVAVAAVSTDVANAGADSRIFSIARSWTTSHLHAGQFTAACGVHVYRGDALPAEFNSNIFVCDPTAHLVHREIMKPHGVTFTATPARPLTPPQVSEGNGEENGVEFLASRDEWFSPVNLEIGPDGALYVVDMYRAVIEHPHWMPTELRQRPDLVKGNDRGRIYRVVPKDFPRPPVPRLSSMPSDSLVELLAHPIAWWRETAARLLLERQAKSVELKLRQVALDHDWHVARIHALRLLEGLDLVDDALLFRLLDDAHPRILEQAIIAAECRVDASNGLRDRISQLVGHDDARVRFQVLVTAQPLPSVPASPADRWELDAMLIAAGNHGGTALSGILQHPTALAANVCEPKRFIADLARLAAASKNDQQRTTAIESLLTSTDYGRAGLAGLLAETVRAGTSLADLQAKLDDKARRDLDHVFADARIDAADAGQSEAVRLEAIDLLAFPSDALETLRALVFDDASQVVRVRAIEALAKQQEIEPWRQLFEQFSRETPSVQRAILAGALASTDRARLFLGEIAAGRIKPNEVDLNQARLLLHRVFADAVPGDREEALAKYRVVLKMKSDAARGRAVFEKHCAICHQVAGMGVQFAPDISDSREKTAEQLLTDIIQPNRAIDSNYFSYTATTVNGVSHTGVLTAETSTSVTLKQAEGKEVTLRRDEIEELRSDGVSFMPDGMEKNIPPQDMADLIGFIKHWRYLDGGPEVPAAEP